MYGYVHIDKAYVLSLQFLQLLGRLLLDD